MMKRFNTPLLFAVLFFAGSFQKASAQTDVLNFLQAKLDTYNKKFLQEKLYVHTDKNFYTAGEIVWFRVYDVEGFFNKPVIFSKVAYVEILDKNNNPVSRAKIALDEKSGNGSVQLPLTVNSGYYTLRAYTNW